MATGLKTEGASAAAMRRLDGMLQIRRFEEQVLRMGAAGAFPGHFHVYIGQEPTAIAVCEMLLPEDLIFTTWRNHGHLLARGANPDSLLAEILGRATGLCRGKSGTLHLASVALGVPATSAMVGLNQTVSLEKPGSDPRYNASDPGPIMAPDTGRISKG